MDTIDGIAKQQSDSHEPGTMLRIHLSPSAADQTVYRAYTVAVCGINDVSLLHRIREHRFTCTPQPENHCSVQPQRKLRSLETGLGRLTQINARDSRQSLPCALELLRHDQFPGMPALNALAVPFTRRPSAGKTKSACWRHGLDASVCLGPQRQSSLRHRREDMGRPSRRARARVPECSQFRRCRCQ